MTDDIGTPFRRRRDPEVEIPQVRYRLMEPLPGSYPLQGKRPENQVDIEATLAGEMDAFQRKVYRKKRAPFD